MKRFIVSGLLVLLLVATIFFSLFARLELMENYNADPTLEPVICEVVELTAPPMLEGE